MPSDDVAPLLALVSDLACVLDVQGDVQWVNAAFERELGYSLTEAQGVRLEQWLHPDDQLAWSQMSESASLAMTTARLRRKDGRYLNLHWACQPRAEGWLLTAQVVPTSSADEWGEHFYQMVARAAWVGLYHQDANGYCTYVNERWCELSGLSYDESLGLNWKRAVHPEDSEHAVGTREQKFEARLPYTLEYRLLRPDGSSLWVLDHTRPVFDHQGTVIGYVGSVTDITQRKQAEATLQRTNEYLAALAEATQSLLNNLDAEAVLTVILNTLKRLLDTQHTFISIVTPENEIQLRQGSGVFALYVDKRYSAESGLEGLVTTQNMTLKIDNYLAWLTLTAHQPIHSAVAAPLTLNGRVAGVIGAAHIEPNRPFSEEGLEALRRFAELASLALEKTQLYSETQTQRDFAMQLTRAMGQGLILVGTNDVTEYANPTSAQMLGYSEAEMSHLVLRDLLSPDGQARTDQAWAERLQGKTSVYEQQFRRKDGTWLPVLVSASPYWREGKVVGAVVVMTDLTERQRAEAELRQALQRADEFAQAAEAASQAKSQFLTVTSHEIRNPLHVIQGWGRELADSVSDPLQRDLARRILAESNWLLAFTEDLLDHAKIEAGKFSLTHQDFNVRELIDDVIAVQSFRMNMEKVTLAARIAEQVPALLKGDARRLRQILLNLVGNAIKYTPSGTITLSLFPEALATTSLQLRFEIQDSGIGMSAEAVMRLFKPFELVAPDQPRRVDSHGLGLVISRQLAEMMGGTLGVHSAEGRGSTFWFTAQFEPATTSARPPLSSLAHTETLPVHAPADSSLARILVVDDQPSNQGLLLLQLHRLGYWRIEMASNGHEAIERVEQSGPFSLTLMDCQMPGLDGYQATHLIRAREALQGRSRMPIVAMTASASHDERDRCLLAGMNDCLSKPFDLVDLSVMLARWLPLEEVTSGLSSAFESSPADAPQRNAPLALSDSLRDLHQSGHLAPIVEMFLMHSQLLLTQMREAVQHGNRPSLQQAAHALRGASVNLGAVQLADDCAQLEQASAASAASATTSALERVLVEYQRVEVALREMLRQ